MDFREELEKMISPKLLMNSYKLFLIKALINIANYDSSFYSFNDLAAWLCTYSWPITMSYGKRLKPLDKLFDINVMLLMNTALLESSSCEEVYSQIIDCDNKEVKRNLKILMDYVPYRLLSYRWSKDLRGVNGYQMHKQIVSLSHEDPEAIYKIESNHIILSTDWNGFFIKNRNYLNSWIDEKIQQFLN